ncbi:acyl-CoA dehydrogenase family protein [Sporichthya polymorpha]|uniref:acyl-CoA dehydrogenase family protein n=1 Tax=Sporichthya polymorpha TaxID=35751 RepID=UPI00035E6D80|nr:acyl-CoA dehydrogenase family protein [Sporichthya polymorpha]
MRNPLDEVNRPVYDSDHRLFRDSVRTFLKRSVLPFDEEWESKGIIDRSFYTAAGDAGLLLFGTPTEFGGAGTDDFRLNAILGEEAARAGMSSAGLSLALQNDVVGAYMLELTNPEQRQRWLPGLTSGELIGAIAMSEPGTGSDLAGITTRARREGDHYVLDGAKTFISSGQNADLVIVVARTGDHPHRGLSLLVVERGTPGFERGRNLDKIGLHGQDTSELFFSEARVPVANLLGQEGEAFSYLVQNLPQERLSLACTALGAAAGVLSSTYDYVTNRKAFGQKIGSFQNSRFTFAELVTELTIARTFLDDCVRLHVARELSAEQAAMAKYWVTELQVRTADRCLQLHGGYGYMREYPVSRAFVDARVQTIYGGTNEIMREIIGRSLGL